MLNIKELSDVIDDASTMNYLWEVYYNKKTHKIFIENTDDNFYDEEDEFREIDPDLMFVVVEPFGREMFHAFFMTVEHPNVRKMLFDRFHGSNKYHKVKNLFSRYKLLEKFYKFKDEYHLMIAKKWCEANKVSYIDENGNEVIL